MALQTISIIQVQHDTLAEEDMEIVDAMNKSGCYLRALKSFKIRIILPIEDDISNAEFNWLHELELIKFILSCSPFLGKMEIGFDDRVIGFERPFMRELLRLRRSWERVKFSFYFSSQFF